MSSSKQAEQMSSALAEWKRQCELMNENMGIFESLTNRRSEIETLMNTKCDLIGIIRKCCDSVRAKSVEELTTAARKLFNDEATFKGVSSVLT